MTHWLLIQIGVFIKSLLKKDNDTGQSSSWNNTLGLVPSSPAVSATFAEESFNRDWPLPTGGKNVPIPVQGSSTQSGEMVGTSLLYHSLASGFVLQREKFCVHCVPLRASKSMKRKQFVVNVYRLYPTFSHCLQ